MNRIVILAVLSCLLFCGRYSCLQAQWSTDPTENTVINDATGSQRNPYVVTDMAGGAIVVWENETYEHGLDIYAQRIDLHGYLQWDTSGVPICTASDPQLIEDVISDGYGGAIVLWRDYRDAAYGMDPPNYLENALYAQRIDSSGTILWEENGQVVRSLIRDFVFVYCGRLTTDDGGGAFIAWGDNRGAEFDIFTQHVSGNGEVLWNENGLKINQNGPVYSYEPFIVSDASGGTIILIHGYWAHRFNASGERLWPMEGITIGAGGDNRVISNGTGGMINVGLRFPASTLPYIQANRLNNSGVLLWGEEGITLGHGQVDYQTRFSLSTVTDGSNGTLIYWGNTIGDTLTRFTQRISGDGVILWDNPITIGGVPMISDGECGAIFQYSDTGTEEFDSFLQRINCNGLPQWGEGGALFRYREELTPSSSPYRMITDGNGGAIIVWEEQNLSTRSWDVLGQRVNYRGQLGNIVVSVQETFEDYIPKEIELTQNYPNPFNSLTTIHFSIPETGYVEITIYNIVGERIRTLTESYYPHGLYIVSWDGKNFMGKEVTSGIYIYKLKMKGVSKVRKMIYIK